MAQQKTRKNKKLSNIHQKNDLFKTSKSQRHSNYCGLRKSSVGSGTLRPGIRQNFRGSFFEKMEIRRSILRPLEIRRATKNRHFQRRSVLLAPKMPSTRRPRAKVEKWIKKESKNDRFWDAKSSQSVELSSISCFSQF